PDFMTFYGTTATAAGIVVPKKYLTQVGEDAFRRHPIGAGPYRYVSHTPGVDVVLEAYTGHWRRVPSVKRLIMKSVSDGNTRVAMLKNGEADIAYALDGQDAENVRRDPRLTLLSSRHASIFWIEFAEQWDPKSPWHDKRLRLAVNHAIDRKAINDAACLGLCPPAGDILACAASSSPPRATRATPRVAWRPSCTRRAPTPTAAIPTSTTCSCSRRASAIPAGGRRCSIASSSCRSSA